MTHRKSMLSAAIAASLCLAGQTHAQDADATPAADATELDTVVVRGIRASLERSLDTKRNASSIVEAITAEDIGKFPNTNAAEAMVQIPGITLDRRFGQGERVSIDGTDPSLNLTLLDGHPLAQTIWLYGEAPNRGFDHTLIASEILGRIEVYKAPEARLPEGSLGGTVLMHTRKPLDMDANTISGSVSYAYSQQAEKGKPGASLLYSWKNPDETFGVAVAAQKYNERVDRQALEIFGYAKASSYANVTGVDPDLDVPNSINAAWFQQDRERDSVVVSLQFKPNAAFEAQLSGLSIKESFDNYNQSFYSYNTWTGGTLAAMDSLIAGPDGVATGGHSGANADPGGATVVYDNQVRMSEVTTEGVDLNLSYRGDGWRLSGQAGGSDSENGHMAQYFIEPVYNGSYSWDIENGITFDDPEGARDPSNWRGDGWMGNNGIFAVESSDRYAQADFSKFFGGAISELQVGARYHKHEESFRLDVYGGVRTGGLDDVGTIGLTDLNRFGPHQAQHIQVGRENAYRWVIGSPLDFANPDPGSTLNNTWALTQESTAAYAQLNFSTDVLRGNVGLRYVEYDTEGSGYNYSGQPVLPAPEGWWQTRSSKSDYLLPSLNLIYDPGNDLVLRFAAAKVMAWSPYNQLVNNTFLNDSTLTGSGGNADLEPYEAVNLNLSAEYYFAPESVVAASVFYKDVSNYIDQIATVERWYNSIRDNDPTLWEGMVGNNGCDADGFCDYSITRPGNAGDAKIKGINLSYQQAFASGFGVTANYTYADGETDQGNPMPYQSKNSYSVSPYFERGPFSARVGYSWRSSYLAGGYVAGAAPASVDAYADLSLSLGWKVTDQLSLSLDGMNLLDEEYFQYLGDKAHIAGKYKSGRRYMATVRFGF